MIDYTEKVDTREYDGATLVGEDYTDEQREEFLNQRKLKAKGISKLRCFLIFF